MEATGNCYEATGEFLMDKAFHGEHAGYTLVHGRPTLQVPPFIEYGHAWIEFSVDIEGGGPFADSLVMCVDVDRGNTLPRPLFYALGNIDPDQCFRYTYPDLARWVTETGHWGPWEGPEACGTVINEEDDDDE